MIEDILEIDTNTDQFTPPQDPAAHFEWEKSGRRHNPAYYEKLKHSQAVSCFGGYFSERILRPRALALFAKAANKLIPERFAVISQWDSFRLWEVFSAGCLVFHVDFDKYGLQLPVMPQNLQHYLGVDFDNMQTIRDILNSDQKLLAQIAENGKQWALENYSPSKTAQRFLSTLGFEAGI